MPETQIAVINERLNQICKDIASLEHNVEKMANGQETRLRELEQHRATEEERWEAHWRMHQATTDADSKAWADHAEVHDTLKTKQNVADIVNGGLAILWAGLAVLFGSNK